MTKSDFLERIASVSFKVVGVRIHHDRNYGLDKQTYSLWLVGSSSYDETLTMGADNHPLCVRFTSLERAHKEKVKLEGWLK